MPNPEIVQHDSTPLFFGGLLTVKTTVAQDIGQIVQKGQALGAITASGLLAVTKSASVDGSEKPRYIALETADLGTGNVDMVVATAGRVDITKLIFDGSDGVETLVDSQSYLDWLRQSGFEFDFTGNIDFYDNNLGGLPI